MSLQDPIIVDCPLNQWTLVAENIRYGHVHQVAKGCNYSWTYRTPGGSAPVSLGERIRLFDKDDNEVLPSTTGVDLYIYADGRRDGRVRIDKMPTDIDVNNQDQRSSPVDLLLSRDLNETTFASTPAIGDSVVTLTDATGAVANTTWLEVWDLLVVGQFMIPMFTQTEILNVAGSDVTISMPIGFPFDPSRAVVRIVEVNMSIPTTATFASPLIYSLDPPKIIDTEQFVDFDETRFFVHMIHEAAGDDTRYGSITGGLTNGIYFRGRGTLPGPVTVYNNLFNVKLNGDWRERAFDVDYNDRAQAQSNYATTVRKTFNGDDKSGVVIPNRASLNESTEALLRDDISITNTDFIRHHIVVNGHVVVP